MRVNEQREGHAHTWSANAAVTARSGSATQRTTLCSMRSGQVLDALSVTPVQVATVTSELLNITAKLPKGCTMN